MSPPDSICLLRTSAIGDVTHVVPLMRTLQAAWPQARLTWIVGKLARELGINATGGSSSVMDGREMSAIV